MNQDSLIPANESERLAAVHRYDILDTPIDGAFDRITALAARFFQVPISIVSIVDHDRIWFKSHHGLEVKQIGREPGLCASAILQDNVYTVVDAKVDPRTLANPLVAGDFGLRFYAGFPLQTSDGFNLGTLCVIDQQPREITEAEKATLQELAAIVIDELELRLAAKKAVETELALREAALEATRAKSEFLATMSHEIRTPMNGVIGMTELMLNTKLTSQQQHFVETIRHSGEALLTIINDILDFSKIESQKLELEKQPFNILNCLEESLDILAPKAAEKNLELAYIIQPNTPKKLIGDVTRLRQIIINLLSNAVKFTKDGEVLVSITSHQLPAGENIEQNPHLKNCYELQFAVKDTGIGIPTERMDRLFQSFSQVDSSTTREYGGTGLGLAISKRLTELMGGRMWVESTVGQGSIFYFTIIAPSVADGSLAQENIIPPQLVGKQLLIVDDNATNREILMLQGQSWGMLTYAANSGAEALDLLSEGKSFDMAILDMQMPEMDGLTLAREIRGLPKGEKLPLVMLSSLGKLEIGSEVDAVKFAAFLYKPIKQSQLFNTLNDILAQQPIKVETRNCASLHTSFDSQLAKQLPLRILLAEDNSVNQQVALYFLEQIGYLADVAANGLEVLEALQRQAYDVVLMDVQMPVMDGLATTRQINAEYAPTARPRIIAMTANTMQGDKEECLQAGMDDYISKPIQLAELYDALSKCQPKDLPLLEAGKIEAVEYQEQALILKSDDEQSPLTNSLIPSAIDYKILQSFCSTMGKKSSGIVVKLIDCYLEDAPKLLESINSAIATVNSTQLRHAAHTLKASSAALGATNLASLSHKLEILAQAGMMNSASESISQMEAEYNRVKVALEREKQHHEF
ncbi:multi-sensor hybrid histidine kinase [Crinalium epipsammum PCC 9333]|uniref:Circadian input-output histidine kinase CikA n=1 Tax=Crinalium epipsammum PCC 9333 TaxID=1173022 RepID=K9W516_9CYAN|nr:response regulator [Crinalium epipsammum]AFZ14842.1 multi-sensor hybrid histidine kinase [Crinalium epipsammum PCC 9333]